MNLTKKEIVKNITNKKVLLGGIALLMGLVVICVTSFIPYAISPEGLRSERFITSLIVNCSIVILAACSSLFIGQASNANNPLSKIAKSTVAFLESKAKVIALGVHNFKQWIKRVQQPADVKEIKERILSANGIDDYTILNLSVPEIKLLENTPQMYENVAYPALTPEQVKVVISLKSHGVKVKNVPPEYYLTVKSILDKRTRTERAASEGFKKALYLSVLLVSRIFIVVAFSIIWAMLVKDLTQEISSVEAFATLFARLWCFFTSIFFGYIIGCKINDLDSEYIDMRVETHLEFIEDKNFVSKSIKEIAKDQFIERMKTEQRTPMVSNKEIQSNNLPSVIDNKD